MLNVSFHCSRALSLYFVVLPNVSCLVSQRRNTFTQLVGACHTSPRGCEFDAENVSTCETRRPCVSPKLNIPLLPSLPATPS